MKTDYTSMDLSCWGERELIDHILKLQNEVNKQQQKPEDYTAEKVEKEIINNEMSLLGGC